MELETGGPSSLDPAAIAKRDLAGGAATVQLRSDARGAAELQEVRVSMEP